MQTEIHERRSEFPVDATREASFRQGPLRRRWRSAITGVVEGERFVDVQTSGPFASWTHTHVVEPLGEGRSALVDRVEYALPLGALGRAVAGRWVRGELERMFAHRHRVTEEDLLVHEDAQAPLDVLVTGASGLVGRQLCAFLATGGHRVRRLVRRAPQGPDEFRWDPETGQLDGAALEGVDAVVHLAGENVAGRRWSRAQKERIRRSRVEGTRLLADAVRAAEDGPRVVVSASAGGSGAGASG